MVYVGAGKQMMCYNHDDAQGSALLVIFDGPDEGSRRFWGNKERV